MPKSRIKEHEDLSSVESIPLGDEGIGQGKGYNYGGGKYLIKRRKGS